MAQAGVSRRWAGGLGAGGLGTGVLGTGVLGTGVLRTGVLAASGLTLSACAGGPAPAGISAPGVIAAGAPVQVQTRALTLPSPYGRHELRDTCGKAELAWLVGRPETLIPIIADLSHRRVACTACPPPSDVRLDRVNILYDAQTRIIVRLSCG